MSQTFADLPELARYLRTQLDTRKFVVLYAYNGTGKTRLSTAFKNIGKTVATEGEVTARDTLYFNAFTEDLFQWDNDLANDSRRVLKINSESRFFAGLAELEMDNRIRPLLSRYADFDFRIDTAAWTVSFSREETLDGVTTTVDDIKVSRGEENIFIWCFFLAIVQLVLDGAEAYAWVKYVYIDDPISSLDEHNAIVVANHLVQLYRDVARNDSGDIETDRIKVSTVISTHHHLFFNVLYYELKNDFRNRALHYVLTCPRATRRYELIQQKGDTPSFHHVAALVELDKVARGDDIHTHHFNMLRAVLEKTALFLGYTHFSACIKSGPDDADGVLHQRFVDLLNHGKYSLYEPEVMGDETKRFFRAIVQRFLDLYPYNKALFPAEPIAYEEPAP
ncbi:MAG: anticodon nuclease [Lysobacteraceae bacterium]|nr:MAG: anticodon nuclease [Xanthomonadaceae bacterium]